MIHVRMMLWLCLCGVCPVLGWELSLLHVNDIHARMEETSVYSGPCTEEDKLEEKCFGGLARISKAVKKFKKEDQNVVWLNGGDFFQGTIWYSKFKWKPVAQFNNLLDFDAMTLGNHEFDHGLEGLIPFLKKNTCPVVVANLDATDTETELDDLVSHSIVLTVGGKKVGVVGYLTPETVYTSNPPKELEFLDEVESVTKEVEKLTKQGIDIIIALGHSGYEKDKEIAEKVPNIDIVVGAHTHSFLFSETDERKNPSNNEIEGPYPTVVTNTLGQTVLVVQAFAFTKYLGHIKVNFSNTGQVTEWQGMPILLDSTFGKDEAIISALVPWQEQLKKVTKKIVGASSVFLSKSREKETNLGNMLADAMIFAYRKKTTVDGLRFKLALLNSGGIRSSIDVGNITLGEIITVFPFEHTVDSLSLTGSFIRKALEKGVSEFSADGKNNAGQFFQVSGFQVTFDVTRDPGFRVLMVRTLCKQCTEDMYVDLNEDETYPVLTNSYIANGGDGMTAISNNRKNYAIGDLDTDVLQDYLEENPLVHPETEGRIKIVTSTSSSSTVLNSLVFPIIILFLIFTNL
eukprot:GFUD01134718.1.p1 GENE.GFUD01134718.1~~GFUD01134718.1.p1  ORF type:complete len:573 (+),score=142.63 GFUD01134718.1:442-2160(+)